MVTTTFDIYAQLQSELTDFFKGKLHLAGTESLNPGTLGAKAKGYYFSQWETLNLIELYYNSKFESGAIDSEGQQKIFLNICKFRANVAAKQTDIDVKDFLFVPEELSSDWGAFFLSKQFKRWAKKNELGKLINEVNTDYSKFGTAVVKKVGKKLERVPLLTLRNSQDAKSLKEASYVIEEHSEMTKDRMAEYKDWDISNVKLGYGEKATVYERYGSVPKSWFNKIKGLEDETDQEETVECLAIISLSNQKEQKPDGNILFLEQVDREDRPYEEVHWDKGDGRWLGVGEIENQFENQKMKNTVLNLRKRSLFHASRQLFQSKDTESLLAKNLVRDVKDGDILKISPNGEVTQVNQQTQSLGDYQAMDNTLDKSSDQLSFTYESATGEAMPSGTPFRLGILLSNAVQSHFDLKKENIGMMWESVVFNLLFPIFKKEHKEEHIISLATSEEGLEELKQETINTVVSDKVLETLLKGDYPDVAQIRQDVETGMTNRRRLDYKIKDNFYNALKVTVQLVITGEQMNIPKRIETLTTLYQSMVQVGDPRADKILSKILTLSGENYGLLAGVKAQAPAQPSQEAMAGQIPAQQALPNQLQPQLA